MVQQNFILKAVKKRDLQRMLNKDLLLLLELWPSLISLNFLFNITLFNILTLVAPGALTNEVVLV